MRMLVACKAFLLLLLIGMVVPCVSWAKVWKAGYLQAGDYWSYSATTAAIFDSLSAMSRSKYLGWHDSVVLAEGARLSPGWDNKEGLKEAAKELLARADLDIILSAGTGATAALIEASKDSPRKTPIVAFAVTDAIASGFVASETDSGMDNLTVRLVPGWYKRMFEVFHEVVGFRRLGIMYPDTVDGRRYSNVEEAREVAAAAGFELVEYSGIGPAEDAVECQKGLNYLYAKGIDAFFIGPLLCFDWKQSDVKSLLGSMVEHDVASFAREGTPFVRSGALLGFSTSDYSGRGRFSAEQVVRILQGAKPRSLPMVDNDIPKISFNLAVAEDIGYDPPFDLLAASDEVFQTISLPSESGQ